jgi:hypothetical protein
MMKRLAYLMVLAISLGSCGTKGDADAEKVVLPTREEMKAEIVEMHNTMLYDNLKADKIKANKLYDLAVVFLARFEKDESRKEIIQYAEAAARGADKIKNAELMLQQWIDEFPMDQERPKMMSLRAYTLWELGDIAGSTKIYEQLITDYPGTDWAKDAEGSLMMNSLDSGDGKLPDYFEKPNS